ncbi:hypothetical protein AYL99_10487 [Fonsecaea erecta]|uniref:Large ribosomal subunit protein bL21m n=1 Tax=Fonsecaea erecta TaxID=1367422 RepID=A0A178Z6X0_9EURO|nr:hypothetical protein AYL99_10487 [Fonsecaea erecta]OAP55514.1 hypothetical protein AYL99_10487 [Fonsecaea erecta]
MCRLCGRVVKCIFDSMPSRVPSSSSVPRLSNSSRSLHHPPQTRSHHHHRHVSSRTLVQSALNIPTKPLGVAAVGVPPPSFLLPFRARLHQARTLQSATTPVSQFQNTPPETIIPPPSYPPGDRTTNPQTPSPSSSPLAAAAAAATDTVPTTTITSVPPPLARPLVLSRSLQTLLPKLHAQTPHYVVAHVHRFPYLVTAGDVVRLPFHMKGVAPGDVLRLNRASVLGSRDYTLKAGTAARLFECRVRVLGVETQPMTLTEKKKRRNRHRKIVRSKHRYTLCRVMQVRVKSLDELLRAEKGAVLLEGGSQEEN